MSHSRVSKALRERIEERDRHRCSYCLTPEAITGAPMELDHIIPESLGGPTEPENLCLACGVCNSHKAGRIAAHDPESGAIVRLFDPLRQAWMEHMGWSSTGDRIEGRTACGRATIVALHLNRPSLVAARRRWSKAGWHPPVD
ncbi:MAG TPA: HNH endonuclease signature motif containing protein [Polyangiaceae bacterium]|nr:HNH endonuclease signature motif containing protein [Polyangiaceae bacterium]